MKYDLKLSICVARKTYTKQCDHEDIYLENVGAIWYLLAKLLYRRGEYKTQNERCRLLCQCVEKIFLLTQPSIFEVKGAQCNFRYQ